MAEEKKVNPQVEELKKQINVLKGKITTYEETKEKLIKKRDEEISKTLYAKKNEIENTYGEILTEAEKRLKVSKYEKDKERKKNIDVLVRQNTKETKDKIFFLKNEIKRLLKDNKLPSFVNSDFYFTVWFPYNIWQVVKGFLLLVFILAIPTFLIFVVFKKNLAETFPVEIFRIIIIIMIYLAVIFVFACIWLIIDKTTKKKPEILKEIIEFRKDIKENEKEINKITKKTEKEIKDEDFDYTKLDREIETGEIEVKNLKEKKQNALTEFTNTKQDEIIDKITKAMQAEIEKVEAQIEEAKKELLTKQHEHDELKIKGLDDGNTI